MTTYNSKSFFLWLQTGGLSCKTDEGDTNLRSNVIWSATEGGREIAFSDVLFAHAKVSHLHMTFSVQQDVVQLQISAKREGKKKEEKKKLSKHLIRHLASCRLQSATM